MNRTIFLLFCYILLPHILISQDTVQFVIKVISAIDNSELRGASVTVHGYGGSKDLGTTRTLDNGLALYKSVPNRNYRLEVSLKGYEYHNPSNPIKVTPSDNDFEVKLRPLPLDSFIIHGHVYDSLSGNAIENVNVSLRIGAKFKDNQTNEWGYYSFRFHKNDASEHPEFELNLSKQNYEMRSRAFGGPLVLKHIEVPTIKLKPIIHSQNKDNINTENLEGLEYRKKNITTVMFGASPYFNLFTSSDKSMLGGVVNFEFMWQIVRQTYQLKFGIGWHTPFMLKTLNVYETLIGMKNVNETSYRIRSIGYFNGRYYSSKFKINKSKLFLGLSGYVVHQDPNPSLIYQNSHEAELESYYQIVPKLTLGISIKKKRFDIEPYLSFSYIRLDSQNIIFNYFGTAEYEISVKNYLQFTIGLNFDLILFNL